LLRLDELELASGCRASAQSSAAADPVAVAAPFGDAFNIIGSSSSSGSGSGSGSGSSTDMAATAVYKGGISAGFGGSVGSSDTSVFKPADITAMLKVSSSMF
jgi:hypothetical protein